MKEVLKEVKFKFFTNWLSSIWKEEIKTRRKFQLILQTQKIIYIKQISNCKNTISSTSNQRNKSNTTKILSQISISDTIVIEARLHQRAAISFTFAKTLPVPSSNLHDHVAPSSRETCRDKSSRSWMNRIVDWSKKLVKEEPILPLYTGNSSRDYLQIPWLARGIYDIWRISNASISVRTMP